MRLQTVPARQGVQWVRLGFRAFGKRPLAFAALFASVLVALFLVRLVPLLIFLVLPLMPLLSLGFMIATRTVTEGGFPTLRVFAQPLQAPRPRVVAMIRLGLVYAVATFFIMWLGDLVDGGTPEVLVDASAGASASAAASAAQATSLTPNPYFGLLLRFGLASLLAVPFWHAPALVHWDGHSCGKALFSSTIACWRNRGAFAVYGIVWLAVLMVLSTACGLLMTLLGQTDTMAASIPMTLIVATVYYASLYFTFADCFLASEPTTPRLTAEEAS